MLARRYATVLPCLFLLVVMMLTVFYVQNEATSFKDTVLAGVLRPRRSGHARWLLQASISEARGRTWPRLWRQGRKTQLSAIY